MMKMLDYASLPKDIYVLFNQALYPIKQVKWCIYALFIQDQNRIKKIFKISTQTQTANMTYNLDGYLWAISALVTEKLQIWCVMNDQYVNIKPPLQDTRHWKWV